MIACCLNLPCRCFLCVCPVHLLVTDMLPFRRGGQGTQPPMKTPNIRSKAVCRYCVHCGKPVNITQQVCKYEYCGQPVQLVPMPPCPAGWTVCPGCKHVFLREGQRFCGL
ncbi:unnamed protein product, partial [Allacma fusca]